MVRIKGNSLRLLQRSRRKCDWNDENQRIIFLRQLMIDSADLLYGWSGPRANLLDLFRPEEIDWLISKAIENWTTREIGLRYGQNTLRKFVEFIVGTGYKDQTTVGQDGGPRALLHTTPVHLAHRHNCLFLADQLFKIYNRYDVNYTDESGISHFHIASKLGCYSVVEKFLQFGHDPDCFVLHLALENGQTEVAELLLRSGADPNLAFEVDGWTPLHVICAREGDDSHTMEDFFAVNDEIGRTVRVDARDKMGCTPLFLAYEHGNQEVARVLLMRGADSNLANEDGLTPLHVICGKTYGAARMLIEFEELRPLQLDVRDKNGDTPLHHAIHCHNKDAAEFLLSRGVDPNLANPGGWTPLHMACEFDLASSLQLMEDDKLVEFLLRRGADPNSASNNGVTPTHFACRRGKGALIELFLKVNKDIGNDVQFDARDMNGLTPLQWAVTNLELRALDALLNHGANLSSFVFPTFDNFDECLKSWVVYHHWQLEVASGLVAVVERLEERGYELDRGDALTIMRLFDKYDLLNKENDSWSHSEECSMKEITIKPNLSLYDLIQLSPKQAAKLITHADYMNFARSYGLGRFPVELIEKCYAPLCEIISRKFFLDWALDPLVELLHYRLPILCCDKIADNLMNEDLMNICFAAERLRAPKN